mmetsp:Transcript_94980/g.245346  ORF Transcript_94980/g.245346 Transcript_94980/m.245346 type:complete len:271 (+) Transcript_94980:98-910(+)
MADRGRVGSLRTGCRAAAEKVWRREHEAHRQRIKQVRPATDMTQPDTMAMDHFRTNLKKERLLEERYMEIDRENAVLLKKMSEAMRKPNQYTNKPKDSKTAVGSNRMGRKLELIRITQENQRMLKSIQAVQPVYSTKKWEENFKKSEYLLKNCSDYPIITRMTRSSSSPSVMMSLGPDEGAMSGSGSMAQAKDNVVLKEGKQIGDTYYLLEFSTDGRALSITAYDGESGTSMELLVKEKNHRQMYRDANGDYSLIAEKLRVQGNRLLLDP